MDFYEVVRQAVKLLQEQGKLTYRTLKRQFALDDGDFGPTPQNGLFHDFVTTGRSANEDGSALNLLGVWAKERCVPRSVLSETLRFLCFISCLISPFSHCLRSFDTSGTYSFPPLVPLEAGF